MTNVDVHGDAVKSQDQKDYDKAAEQAFSETQKFERMSSLGSTLQSEFSRAMSDRSLIEQRWIKDLNQFKGEYEPEELAKMGDRAKTYVRKTRVKVKTADSRMTDLLFPNGTEKNWSIKPTPKPTLPEDVMTQLQAKSATLSSQQGIPPNEMLEKLVNEHACKAAEAMTRTINDQITEANYKAVCQKVLHSGNLYGTGLMKGPLLENRVRSIYAPVPSEQGGAKWKTTHTAYLAPVVQFVSLFNWYPDMSSVELEGCRFTYEVHQMTQADMMKLAKRKTFNSTAIRNYVEGNPTGRQIQRSVMDDKRDSDTLTFQRDATYKWDVLERWGWLTGQQLREAGATVKDEDLHEVFFSQVWLLPEGEVLKVHLHDVAGEADWPYKVYYFEKDEDSIFGNGLAEIMRDDQTMINAGVRMMLDNAAFSAGPMFEIDENLLASGENTNTVAPWRTFKRRVQAGNSNQNARAVHVIQTSPNMEGLSRVVSMFDANADEVTAMPRYMSGENVSQGAAGTASGMSMLMGAANIVLKDLLSSWDNGVSQPVIDGLYRWNMKYNPDNAIKGDFCVDAKGASSMIAKEVRAQQLQAFLQLTQNPQDQMLVNRKKALREWANCLEMSDVMLTDEEVEAAAKSPEAQQQAQLMQAQQQLAMAELQGRGNKLMAEAEHVAAKVKHIEAQITALAEQAVSERVQSIFASVQAAQGALSAPGVALAADQIYVSAGGRDHAEQRAQQDSDQAMEMIAQSMAPQQGAPVGTNQPQQAQPQQAAIPEQQAQAQSAMQGANAGMQTARNDAGAAQ